MDCWRDLFFKFVTAGEVDKVQILFSNNFFVPQISVQCAFSIAAKSGELEMIKLLCSRFRKNCKSDMHALKNGILLACERDYFFAFQYLLDEVKPFLYGKNETDLFMDEYINEAFIMAARRGAIKCLSLLLNTFQFEDKVACSALCLATNSGAIETVSALLNSSYGDQFTMSTIEIAQDVARNRVGGGEPILNLLDFHVDRHQLILRPLPVPVPSFSPLYSQLANIDIVDEHVTDEGMTRYFQHKNWRCR